MPTVPHGKVLVTGANGFIAIWVVRQLLEQGYSVRGAVRSEAKGKYLSDYFHVNGGYENDKFEWVVVPDITKVRMAIIRCKVETDADDNQRRTALSTKRSKA